MELQPPITKISWRMATHTASVIIEGSCFAYAASTSGASMAPITFSGSESAEEMWRFSFSKSCMEFWYDGTICVVEGKAELTVGSSPPSSYSCKAGSFKSNKDFRQPVLQILRKARIEDCQISFTVKYFRPEVDEERQYLRCSHLDDEKPHIVLENILSSAKHPDISFVIGNQVISAHKAILATRVPYFDKMLSSGMEEAKTSVVKLDEGIDVAAFKQVLTYIYGGQLPDNLDKEAVNILPFADQYDLGRLRDACFYHMEKGLTKENVFDTLVLADLYRWVPLKRECFHRLHQWGNSPGYNYFEKLKNRPNLMTEFFQFKLGL